MIKILENPKSQFKESVVIKCDNDFSHNVALTNDGEVYCSHPNIVNEYYGALLSCSTKGQLWDSFCPCIRFIHSLECVDKWKPEELPTVFENWNKIN